MFACENRGHIVLIRSSLQSTFVIAGVIGLGNLFGRWPAYCCLKEIRCLKPFNVSRHSPLPERVSKVTVIGQFVFAKGRHAAGRYNNETKTRPFRAFHDHLSHSSGRMDPVRPDVNCFLHHPARYPGIPNPTRQANSDPIGWPSGRPRSQPQ